MLTQQHSYVNINLFLIFAAYNLFICFGSFKHWNKPLIIIDLYGVNIDICVLLVGININVSILYKHSIHSCLDLAIVLYLY